MKTEKRHAKDGDRILVVEPDQGKFSFLCGHRKGDVFEVDDIFEEIGPGVVFSKRSSCLIHPREYEVIVGEETEV